MKILKKIINITCVAISVVLIATFVLICFFNFNIISIESNSMNPVLSVGDVRIIRKQKNYRVGDIVVFEQNNLLIAHRIIAKNDDYDNMCYVCKGDAIFLDFENINLKEMRQSKDIQIVLNDNFISKFILNFLKLKNIFIMLLITAVLLKFINYIVIKLN